MTNEPMVKMMILAPRRDTMTHVQFRDYVINTHGPLVKSIPEVAAGIRRYHYNFPIPGAVDPLFGHPLASDDYDIVTQAWFDSLAALWVAHADGRHKLHGILDRVGHPAKGPAA